jgi:protein-disulfide isomerase
VSGPTAGRRRPRPVGLIVLGLIALVLGASIIGIALQKPDDDPIEITGASTTQRLLGGIRQEGAELGSDSAPVTVEVFNDLQCAPCANYHFEVVTPLIDGPVRDGEVKLVFRHFSVSPRQVTEAAEAAVAAGEQGHQWQYVQLFYINQDVAQERGVTDELLEVIASAVLGLELNEWQEDRKGDEVRESIVADDELAHERKLPAEPAVVITGPRQSRELVESPDLDEVEAAIAEVSG